MTPTEDNIIHSCYKDLRGGKRASPGSKLPAKFAGLKSEPIEEMPLYVISGNHGLTSHVMHWNGCDLLLLHCRCQESQCESRQIVVTPDKDEVDIEHNARTKEPA